MTTRMMTTQRLARASRSRFFIGLAVLILTVGFVAIFHSTQQELQQLHQLEERCEQQQQALAQQLSAGELSARAERLEHQQTKIDLLRRTGEAKEFRDKTLMESNLKFGALQQSYKLLKSQNDDLVDECGKLRRTHLEQLGAVETKLKNIAAQQAQFERQRAREAEDAKIKVRQLEERIVQLLQQQQSAVQGSDQLLSLQRQLDAYQSHCQWRPATSTHAIPLPLLHKPTLDAGLAAVGAPAVDHNFNAQHPVSANLYQIAMDAAGGATTVTAPPTTASSASTSTTTATSDNGAAAAVPGAADASASAPLLRGIPSINGASSLIINSVENFQIVPKRQPAPMSAADAVEVAPAAGRPPPASLSSTTVRSEAVHVPHAGQSAATAATTKTTTTTAVTKPKRARQIPDGVVPIRDMDDQLMGGDNAADGSATATTPATATAGGAGVSTSKENNNRYANVLANNGGGSIADGLLDEADDANTANEEMAASAAARPAGGDVDNGAHEVMDTFLVDGHSVGHKDHMQLVLEDRKLGVGAAELNNNAAEDEDGNNAGTDGRSMAMKEENEEDNAILGGRAGRQQQQQQQREAKGAGAVRKMPSDAKLLHEIAADSGKVAGYQDEAHLEDVLEEEGDDDDEYANLAARNAEPAVRN